MKNKLFEETDLDHADGGLFNFFKVVDYVTTKFDIVCLEDGLDCGGMYNVINYKTGSRDNSFYYKKISCNCKRDY